MIINSPQISQVSKHFQILAKFVMVQNPMQPLFHAVIILLAFLVLKGASVVQFVEFSLMILLNFINNEFKIYYFYLIISLNWIYPMMRKPMYERECNVCSGKKANGSAAFIIFAFSWLEHFTTYHITKPLHNWFCG